MKNQFLAKKGAPRNAFLLGFVANAAFLDLFVDCWPMFDEISMQT